MPIKRPILRYCVLAFLFVITIGYEIPYLRDVLRDEGRTVPFFTIETGTDHVSVASREAVQAGIHRGDERLGPSGTRPNKTAKTQRQLSEGSGG